MNANPKRFILRMFNHVNSFWLPWLLLFAMLVIACLSKPWSSYAILVLAAFFILMLCIKPMNIIYGLIGTRGDVRYFFMLFLLINMIFSSIYYEAFFKKAGITYDLNQPHVEFGMFESYSVLDCRSWMPDTLMAQHGDDMEALPVTQEYQPHFYYRVTPFWVLKNTILTSLMQGPTDFFSTTSTFTGDNPHKETNFDRASTFHWFLIFHILISWILLGVFIALIYQKFRKS